jgi:mRNA interferase HigB
MVIISKATVRGFVNKHNDAEIALYAWYELVAKSDWKNFNEMRQSFNSVDAVGNDRYVFNIKGNNYRLIALIIFKVRTVYILFIGTHSEYDKIDASSIIFDRK